jgi:hypothetical protein
MRPILARIAALIPATGVAFGIYGYLSHAHVRYWVGRDAQQTVANVTKEREHGVVDYKYQVQQVEYVGADQGNYATPTYVQPRVGDTVPVYYSASHPALSSLTPPTEEHMAVWYAWPWLVGMSCMEVVILSVVIYPWWFIRLGERMQQRARAVNREG